MRKGLKKTLIIWAVFTLINHHTASSCELKVVITWNAIENPEEDDLYSQQHIFVELNSFEEVADGTNTLNEKRDFSCHNLIRNQYYLAMEVGYYDQVTKEVSVCIQFLPTNSVEEGLTRAFTWTFDQAGCEFDSKYGVSNQNICVDLANHIIMIQAPRNTMPHVLI